MPKIKKSKADKLDKKSNKQVFNFSSIKETTQNRITGAVLAFVGILILMSFFSKAGILGQWLFTAFDFLIGKTIFIVPFVMFATAYCLFNEELEKRAKLWISFSLIIIGLAGFVGGIRNFSPEDGGLAGWIGFRLFSLLNSLMGSTVSLIAFFAMIVVGGLLFWPFLNYRDLQVPKLDKKKKADKEDDQTPTVIKKVFSPKFSIEKVPEIAPASKEPAPVINEAKPKPEKKPLIEIKTNAPISQEGYEFPPMDLLESDKDRPDSGDIKNNSLIIKRTLQNFGIAVEVAEVNVGPTVTQYAIKPAEGVNIAKIASLSNTLSMALAAHPIRIETPIPGKPLVGIEVPNKQKAEVRLRTIMEDSRFESLESSLRLVLGRDVSGAPIFADLSKMPHLLVAGSTGSGKTICLNSLILSLLYSNSPNTLRLILVDPKRVEFPNYNNLPHLLTPVVYDAQKTLNALTWLGEEMERRFDVIAEEKGSRDIASYNKKKEKRGEPIMPYIVFIIDELADLMQMRRKELEAGIVRLAQKARAVGIHLILATQRPSVNVITGLIKANIPSRIAFRVASQVDSRTILDLAGGEKLLGQGDMLYVSSTSPKPKRLQGAFVSETEIKKVTDFILAHAQIEANSNDQLAASVQETLARPAGGDNSNGFTAGADDNGDSDPLYNEAMKTVVEAGKASTSLLQRRLRVGYARAARLIDLLEQNSIVGPADGAKPRDVLVTSLDEGERVSGIKEYESVNKAKPVALASAPLKAELVDDSSEEEEDDDDDDDDGPEDKDDMTDYSAEYFDT